MTIDTKDAALVPAENGEFYADYSELTADELDASDPEADALIARSRVVSSKRFVSPADVQVLVEQLAYRVQNPSAWEAFEEEGSNLCDEASRTLLSLSADLARVTRERDEAQKSLRTVQNAAKTLASAQGSELEHLRQNATFDHKLRAEHDSLLERDAQMTDALIAAEAENARLRSLIDEKDRALDRIASTRAATASSSDHARLHAALDALDRAREIAVAARTKGGQDAE